MALISSRTRTLLGRSRFLVQRAQPNGLFGERTGRGSAEGLEFVDHRPYEAGDDARFLDANIYARTGMHVVKRFSPLRGLDVTILVDATMSMGIGRPTKLDAAKIAAAVLGHAVLTGRDQLRLAEIHGPAVAWGPSGNSPRDGARGERWLEGLRPEGEAVLSDTVAALRRPQTNDGVIVVLSDLMFEDAEQALVRIAASAGHLLVLHILAPQDMSAVDLGLGSSALIDAETGERLAVRLDATMARRYAEELARWTSTLARTVRSSGGRYVRLRSDVDVDRVLIPLLREQGVLG